MTGGERNLCFMCFWLDEIFGFYFLVKAASPCSAIVSNFSLNKAQGKPQEACIFGERACICPCFG